MAVSRTPPQHTASVPTPANQGSSTSDSDIADKLQVLEKKLDQL